MGTAVALGGGALMAATEWNVKDGKGALSLPLAQLVASKKFPDLIEQIIIYLLAIPALWALAAGGRSRWRGEKFREAFAGIWPALAPLWFAGIYVVASRLTDGDKSELIVGRMVWIGAVAWAAGCLWVRIRPDSRGYTEGSEGEAACDRARTRMSATRFGRPLSVLSFLVVTYAVVFGTLSIMRHVNFHSNLHDLGLYDQMMWNSLRGDWFRCTLWQIEGQYDLKRFGYNFLAEHFMIILVPLLPIYALWQDPRNLLLIQTLALALAAFPLFFLARRAMVGADEDKENPSSPPLAAAWAPLILAAAFLLHPLVQLTNVKEFHADALEPVFIFWAGWALLSRRPAQFVIALLLAMSCKEDVSLSVFALGLYLLVFTRRRRWGLTALVMGALWYVAVIKLIMPLGFRGGEEIRHVYRFGYLMPEGASGMSGILRTLLFNPLYVFSKTADAERLASLLFLFLPVAFLPLRRPTTLLICAPSVAANLLSDWPVQHSLDLHYGVSILPWVFIASALALENHDQHNMTRPLSLPCRERSAVFILVGAVLLTVFFGRSPISDAFSWKRYERTDRHEAMSEAVAAIPPGASVSANSHLGAHLTGRRDIFQYPVIEAAEYVILDVSPEANTFPVTRERYFKVFTELKDSPEWTVHRKWPKRCVILAKKPPAGQ